MSEMCEWHVIDYWIDVNDNWVCGRYVSGMCVADRCLSCI